MFRLDIIYASWLIYIEFIKKNTWRPSRLFNDSSALPDSKKGINYAIVEVQNLIISNRLNKPKVDKTLMLTKSSIL